MAEYTIPTSDAQPQKISVHEMAAIARKDFHDPLISSADFLAIYGETREQMSWLLSDYDAHVVVRQMFAQLDGFGKLPLVTPDGYKKKPIPAKLRWAVFKRDGYRCVLCPSDQDLCADHIVPEARGGEATLENLQTLCRRCNAKKGA